MPKLRRPETKTAAILAAKQQHPDWKPKQIADYLSEQGIAASNSLVSTVLHGHRSRWLNGSMETHSENGQTDEHAEADGRLPIEEAVELFVAAKMFANLCGGIAEARAMLTRLERIIT